MGLGRFRSCNSVLLVRRCGGLLDYLEMVLMGYLIATIKSWNIQRAEKLRNIRPELFELRGRQQPVIYYELITEKEDLNLNRLKETNPRYIFFPHWSWMIPREIYERFECIVFHETDLPFGRGGSPIQNLISMGIEETRISALRVIGELDAGPVYLKRDLKLNGSATEIFNRASDIIYEMILEIIKNEPTPIPQESEF